jgi:uridine phosphorylase
MDFITQYRSNNILVGGRYMEKDESPIIMPHDYLKEFRLDDLHPLKQSAILTFNMDMYDTLYTCTNQGSNRNVSKISKSEFFNISDKHISSRVFWTGDGGPSTAFAMEICIARGAKSFIGLGYTISICPEILGIGDVFIPHAVIRNDGTSTMYVPYDTPVISGNADKIVENLPLIDAKTGLCCCTDSFFKTTQGDIRMWKSMGGQSLDMESGTFLAVAQYYHIPAVLIFVVAETFDGEKWSVNYPNARKRVKDLYNNYDLIMETIIKAQSKESSYCLNDLV